MATMLQALMAIVFAAHAIPNYDVAPEINQCSSPEPNFVDVAQRVVRRFEGRILATRIVAGMTEPEVDRILGTSSRVGSGGCTGSSVIWQWHYYGYEISVSFRSDQKGVMRVDNVCSWPFMK